MKNLLVVVDYQNDFVDGALGFAEARALEAGIDRLVAQKLGEGFGVIFTRDTHGADYLSTREGRFLPVPHCLAGSKGHRLYGALAKYEDAPVENVVLLNKTTFGSKELAAAAAALCGGTPGKIELCGVVTNICVLSNAVLLQAAFENTPVAVHKDLCAALGDGQATALAAMEGLGITLL